MVQVAIQVVIGDTETLHRWYRYSSPSELDSAALDRRTPLTYDRSNKVAGAQAQ
jgi:hypothetical protein